MIIVQIARRMLVLMPSNVWFADKFSIRRFCVIRTWNWATQNTTLTKVKSAWTLENHCCSLSSKWIMHFNVNFVTCCLLIHRTYSIIKWSITPALDSNVIFANSPAVIWVSYWIIGTANVRTRSDSLYRVKFNLPAAIVEMHLIHWYRFMSTGNFYENLSLMRDIQSFFSTRHLEKHLPSLYNRSIEKNEFFCEKCGQTCGTEANDLITHIETTHLQKRKTQDLSDSTLSRPFLCEICGKRYTQSSHLYQHLRFHKGNDDDLINVNYFDIILNLHCIFFSESQASNHSNVPKLDAIANSPFVLIWMITFESATPENDHTNVLTATKPS